MLPEIIVGLILIVSSIDGGGFTWFSISAAILLAFTANVCLANSGSLNKAGFLACVLIRSEFWYCNTPSGNKVTENRGSAHANE